MNRLKRIALISAGLGIVVVSIVWSIDGYRYYALDRAVFTKNRILVGALITLGADPNGGDYDLDVTPWEPNHPVMSATWNSDPEMIVLIASKGGEIDFLYGEGYSPLVFSVIHQDIDCLKTLLTLGADPNFPTGEGTAIEVSTRLGFREITDILTQMPNK